MADINLTNTINIVLKIMMMIGLSLYAVYAGIMVRQEQLMDKVIDESFESVVRMLVILHFIFSIGLLIFAFMIL